LKRLQLLIKEYSNVPIKIAAITACSNVTGIVTPYRKIAKIMHSHNGFCFVDFACSAPYVNIDMHPKIEEEYLDAITFSPHKFLVGPGKSGVLIFNKKLYRNLVTDTIGGGTVSYTNPWSIHDFLNDIEVREDGGTPGFLQVIKTALAIKLKEEMGFENILNREKELNAIVFSRLSNIKNLKILAPKNIKRLGIFSFNVVDLHYNLFVKLLNDRFGIQTRGGCSCAGTYGHYLLNVDVTKSNSIRQKIIEGCLVDRPGCVRLSIRPAMSNQEIELICDSIESVTINFSKWKNDYDFCSKRINLFIKIFRVQKMKLLLTGLNFRFSYAFCKERIITNRYQDHS